MYEKDLKVESICEEKCRFFKKKRHYSDYLL